MYYIKDKNGTIRFNTADSNSALAYYYTVEDVTGYAEAWYNNELVLKTR